MKKIMLLLAIMPLTVHADPQFGPEFDRAILLAAFVFLLVLPLLVAQLVYWGFRQAKGKKTSAWATSIAAILMNWAGVYFVFSGGLSLHGNGLISLSGVLFLAILSLVGALLAAALFTQTPPMNQ